jgi:hypothetical protein
MFRERMRVEQMFQQAWRKILAADVRHRQLP